MAPFLINTLSQIYRSLQKVALRLRCYLPLFTHLHPRCPRSPLSINTSTSPGLHRDSRAPDLHTATITARVQSSIPSYRHTCGTPPELHTSTSLRLQRASRPSYLHFATVAVRLHTSMPPLPKVRGALRELDASRSLRLQRASMSLLLQRVS